MQMQMPWAGVLDVRRRTDGFDGFVVADIVKDSSRCGLVKRFHARLPIYSLRLVHASIPSRPGGADSHGLSTPSAIRERQDIKHITAELRGWRVFFKAPVADSVWQRCR